VRKEDSLENTSAMAAPMKEKNGADAGHCEVKYSFRKGAVDIVC
jgi:hypothetical protein